MSEAVPTQEVKNTHQAQELSGVMESSLLYKQMADTLLNHHHPMPLPQQEQHQDTAKPLAQKQPPEHSTNTTPKNNTNLQEPKKPL